MDWHLRPARDRELGGAARWRSTRREIGTGELVVCHVWWGLVRVWLRVRQRLVVEGRERIPTDAPFVLVANHTSHLDALVLGVAVRAGVRSRTFPIAAGDTFFETPLTAALAATLLNALPMWRKRVGPHALEELRTRLVDEPCNYLLFPEGSRSRDGTLQAFKPGIGMLVAGTNVPVVPCHIAGAFAAWPPERSRPRGGHLVLRIGTPRTFERVANERSGWEHVAACLHDDVRALAALSGAAPAE